MTIKDLKEAILKKTCGSSLKIFRCADSFFIAEQYVNQIAQNNMQEISYIDCLQELKDNLNFSLFGETVPTLYVLITDVFSESLSNYSDITNCIIICHKIDKNIAPELTSFVVDFDKLEDWQIDEYIKTRTGLDNMNASWLRMTLKDIYRIENELDKLVLFNGDEREKVFQNLRYSRYSNLISFDSLQLCDAILKMDLQTVFNYFYYKDTYSIEPVGFVNLLITQYKKILLVKYTKSTASDLGMSPAQYKYLQNNYKHSDVVLSSILKFLTDIDCEIKEGKLDVSDETFLSYIICKVIELNKSSI